MKLLAKRLFGFVTIAITLTTVGCYDVTQYSGDGKLVDHGSSAAMDRYVLNLGAVDLSQTGAKSYRLRNLPETNFVVGLEIKVPAADRALLDKKAIGGLISLELTGAGGAVLFAKKAAPSNWTWSVPAGGDKAFVYGKDKLGTYFNASPTGEYVLTFHVLEPDQDKHKYTASLLAKSSGWK